MAGHAKSNSGRSSQPLFSSCQCPTPFGTATYWNVYLSPHIACAVAIPNGFRCALNKHHYGIKLIDYWVLAAGPWAHVGSGEHVAGFEPWPFALQGIALAALDLGCALSSGGCYKSASQLPVGGWWLTGTSPFFQDQPILTSHEPTVLGLLPQALPASLAGSSWALPNPRFMRFGTLCSSEAGAPSNTYCCIQVKQQPQQGLGQKLAHKLLFKLQEVG